MDKYRVVKSRKADSENPIILYKGDQVICREESSEDGDWAGWIYCKSEDNKGWVPKQILSKNQDKATLLEDYNAREFDIEVDEIIISNKILNGWIWGFKQDDADIKGWVPLNCVEEI